MKREKKRKAIQLRKRGKSYSYIKKMLGVSKSTLSYWLHDYPLTKKQFEKLQKRTIERRVEAYRKTVKKRIETRLNKVYSEQEKKLTPLSKRELFIAGLFLYWGEGTKNIKSSICMTNSDPAVLKFTIYWLTKIINIPKSKIRIHLHLYKDMSVKKEHEFWSKKLDIPLEQFRKPYIKNTTTRAIDHSGFGHGTCQMYVGDVRLKEKIIMGIKAITDKYKTRM